MTALLVLRRSSDASALVRHGLPGLPNGLITGLVGGPSAPPALLVSWLQQLLTAKEATNEASRGHLGHRIPVCDAARAGGRLRDQAAPRRRERRAPVRHPAAGHGGRLG